jgi:hypothetical protein
MWNVDRIVGVKNSMQGTRNEMQAVLDGFSAEEERVKADASRSDTWKREMTDAARNKAFTALGPLMRSLSERAAAVRSQARFHESRTLLLSMQKFHDDPAKDAAIRLRHQAELSALGPEELGLVAENALDSGDLATLWQAHLAGRRHAGEKGWVGIDISNTTIPGQAEALQGIHDCEALVAAGELIVGQTSGRLSPTRKMALGRAMAQPSESGQQIGYGRSNVKPETAQVDVTEAAQRVAGQT